MQLSSEMIDLVLRFTFNAAIAYIIIKVIYYRDFKNNDFNTLNQALLREEEKGLNLIILTPWDFCSQLNFREGIQTNIHYFNERDVFYERYTRSLLL